MNGCPKGFFKSERSLRQGDPLSPYLFIMVVDLLGRMASKTESVGLLEGLSMVPFIQFAEDSLFLLKANLECEKFELHPSHVQGHLWVKSQLEHIFSEHGR